MFSITVFIITLGAVTRLAHTQCHYQVLTSFVDFEVQCGKRYNYDVRITCNSDDWTKFPDVNLDLPSAADISFTSCRFPANMSLQSMLNSMKIRVINQITFEWFQFIPNMRNLQGLSSRRIEFLYSNITRIPFDLFYEVNLESFQIRRTLLQRIPEAFSSDWARKVTLLQMNSNKLQNIASNDFIHFFNVIIVDFSDNEIEKIEPGAFDNFVVLKNVLLWSNRLHILPTGIWHRQNGLELLDLMGNSFDELEQNLLVNSKNIKEFRMNMQDGTITTLPHGFFKNLSHLETVSLDNGYLKSLPSDLFAGCSQLQRLNLENNWLTSIPKGLFEDTKNLQFLSISRNRLKSLPPGIFKRLQRLQDLFMNNNYLTSLMSDVLEGLHSVRRFDASNNRLTRIDDQFFTFLKSALSIELSFNQLSFDVEEKEVLSAYQNVLSSMEYRSETSTSTPENQSFQQFNFDSSVNLRFIDLSHNKITQIDDRIKNLLMYVDKIDLSYNLISKIDFSGLTLKIVLRNATAIFKKKVYGYAKVQLEHNLLNCDCNLADLVYYANGWPKNKLYNRFHLNEELRCASPPEFANKKLRDIRFEELNCLWKPSDPGDACTKTCICRKYPGKRTIHVDCSNRNLTRIPLIFGNVHNWSIELNMSGNMLQYSPSLRDSYLSEVTSLDLSNNKITEVVIDLFSLKLQQLKLHGNHISRLDSDVIEYFASNNTLLNLTLHNNKWICDCKTRELQNFVQKKFTAYGFHEMRCYGTNQKLYDMTTGELCKDSTLIIIIASFLIIFLGIVIATSTVLYYKYQYEIKVWLFSRGWCLWYVTEDELDKDKEYDAFISFSHKDEGFVEKEIVAKLEGGPRPYKLCLHYRDWPAGEWIPEQISRSVAESRRTVIVLTRNFLESVWGLMEFRAAHSQALKEGKTRLIIIVHGKIGNTDDLEREIKDYLNLNTVIKWGDPRFWDEVRYALPHSREPITRKLGNAYFIKDHSIEFPINTNDSTFHI